MNVIFCLVITSVVPGHLFEKNLPLALIWNGTDYNFPQTFEKPEMTGVRYFCPVSTDPSEQYLVPVEGNYPLCEKPVKCLLIKSEQLDGGCGIDGEANYYEYVFRIDIGKSATKNLKNLMVYRICYDEMKKETIYTYFPMISPAALESQYLQKERVEVHDIDANGYQLLPNDFTQSLKDLYKMKVWGKKKLKPLMLVSPFDMAFSLWKTTAYNYLNVKPAWENVIKMWNIINDFLRNIAIKVAHDILDEMEENDEYKELNVIQMSGWKDELVLDGEKKYLDKEKTIAAPKYIWKLVYVRKEKLIVAIVFHNIPSEKYYDDSDRFCKNEERFGKKYDILKTIDKHFAWDKFVEFCDHKVITDLYNLPKNLDFLLQKEYVLPLVMSYHEGKFQLPETYNGLRKPADDPSQEQILFCPAQMKPYDKSKEQCLVPIEHNKSYCRKPVQPIDVKSELTHIKCNLGDGQRGSLRDMVYRICVGNEENSNIFEDGDSIPPIEPFNQVVYSFCLDPTELRTHFTYHRLLPLNILKNLLKNKYLKLENVINYQSYDYGEGIEKSVKIKRELFDDFNDPYATKTYDIVRGSYLRRIPLASPGDMVFPLFKRASHHIFNMTIAWEEVLLLRKIIHQRLRFHALLENQELIQINGVMDDLVFENSLKFYHENEKASKYLWIVVYNSEMTHSIAIIIHNIPNEVYFKESERLCQKSMCNVQDWDIDMVSDLNSVAYCCNSDVITDKFDLPKTTKVMEIGELYWPLVLLQIVDQTKYRLPDSFNGLEKPPDYQFQKHILFCPAEENELTNTDDNCLVKNENIVPYCRKSLKYVWRRNEESVTGCSGEDFVDFSVVYRLCFQHTNNADVKTYDQEVFRMCYDQKHKRTRYTFHQINSPGLIENVHLELQQDVVYSFDTSNYLSLKENFSNFESAFKQKKSFTFPKAFELLVETNYKFSLTELMLTPPNHMAFASFIKPTYHFVNVQPAWESVRSTWNSINKELLGIAQKKHENFVQINGSSEQVLDLEGYEIYLDDNKEFAVSKHFWIVVYNEKMTQSVAIIIHNFPKWYLRPSNKLCKPKEDLCNIEALFDSVSTGITSAYCCESEVITEKFNLPKADSALKIGDIKCRQ